MGKPMVSVIVPAFNDERYLGCALESLVAQTYPELEIIVSDDRSSDRTAFIAHEFAKRDQRIRVHVNVTNLGMTRNWNQALAMTQGSYVMKLDSDDAFRPDTVRQLVEAVESAEQPVVAYCRTLSCDAELVPFSSYRGERAFVLQRLEPLARYCRKGHEWYRMAFDDVQLWHSNAQIHRREVLAEMGGWDESWGCASDTDLILRMLERDQPVVHIPYAGVLYRQRAGSISDQYRRNSWLQLESALIHLHSLGRYRDVHGKLTWGLRQAWWRYWNNWLAVKDIQHSVLNDLREDVRIRLLERANSVSAPPLDVHLIGQLRYWLWKVRRLVQ